MDISGKILQLLPLQTGQGKNGEWKKQDFVIETSGQYPKKVCFSLWGDKIDAAKLNAGDTVTVSFDPESREYNGKWYTDLRAWKVAKGEQSTTTYQQENANVNSTVETNYDTADPEADDLPF